MTREPSEEELMGKKPMPGTFAEAVSKVKEAFADLGEAIEGELNPYFRPSTWVEVIRRLIERRRKK